MVIIIILLLPPRSVIGPLAEVRIWFMDKIVLCKGSMGKHRLGSNIHNVFNLWGDY